MAMNGNTNVVVSAVSAISLPTIGSLRT